MAQTHKDGVTTQTGTAHDSGHGNAFPPMDPTTFPSQILWLALTFGVLYLILSRVSLPRIGQVIEERRERIQRDLDDAERMKSETSAALADYERALADAKAKANSIAMAEREKVKEEMEHARAQADAQEAKTLAEAEEQIAAARAAALQKVDDIAVETASAVIDKLIGVKVDRDKILKVLRSNAS